ncbi:MAG: hypothetical protein WCG45_00420 [bacterium]
MKYFLSSGEEVRDRVDSHLHQTAVALLPEALQKISANGRGFTIEEVKFDRIVGESDCVPTGPEDAIIFAKRPNRWGLTRFVRNRQPEKSSSVVVILKKAEEGNFFILITAFIGSIAPPEPWDRNATSESRNFWNTHALVWGSQEVISGTESLDCPW